MELDADLVEILQNIAHDQFSGYQYMQTVTKLVLQLQTARRVIQVAKKLDPEGLAANAGERNADTYLQDPNSYVINGPQAQSVAEKWFGTHKKFGE